jgi:GNAT superfamily N-acetyltransferase
MPSQAPILREATASDLRGISRVRTSVRENLMTVEQLRQLGITNESVAASFLADSKGWVAEHSGEIVAFAIADRTAQSIFALFVLPDWEDCGVGSRLLDLALSWLHENGASAVWLTTGPGTKAAGFYERRGWEATGRGERGDTRYEIDLFPSAAPELLLPAHHKRSWLGSHRCNAAMPYCTLLPTPRSGRRPRLSSERRRRCDRSCTASRCGPGRGEPSWRRPP